eukprot:TRINITY_DN1935_c3_g1_i1.p1 TRINITY_DN1935_c3_g1~~TRINITY_DN1935_c3_g1_i1.p1  ORF type:complete len:318 (+),score=49.45 TRINITY_DN1935_c3_g1_i1:99-1052(+)
MLRTTHALWMGEIVRLDRHKIMQRGKQVMSTLTTGKSIEVFREEWRKGLEEGKEEAWGMKTIIHQFEKTRRGRGFIPLDVPKLEEILHQFTQEGVYTATHLDYISLIPHYRKYSEARDAFEIVLRRIKSDSITLTPIEETLVDEAGCAVLKALKRNNFSNAPEEVPKQCFHIMKSMQQYNVSPTVFHWTLGLSAQKSAGGTHEHIDALWSAMLKANVRPNKFAYTEYISACSYRTRARDCLECDVQSEIARAERKFDEGIRNRIDDLSIAASVIMKMIVQTSNPQSAERFMNKISTTHSVPNTLLASFYLLNAKKPR